MPNYADVRAAVERLDLYRDDYAVAEYESDETTLEADLTLLTGHVARLESLLRRFQVAPDWCQCESEPDEHSLACIQRDLAALLPPATNMVAVEQPPCAGCGGPHPFDTTIPSMIWNRVIRSRGLRDYLCTTCIIKAFAEAGEGFDAELWGAAFYGTRISLQVLPPATEGR